MKNRLIISLILIGLLFGIITFTTAANLNGDEVLTKIKEANNAKSVKLTAKMESYDANGDKMEHKLKWISKNGRVDKSLIRLLAPANLKDTAFLTKNKNNSRDMYLYLSELESSTKLTGRQQNSSFLETNFSYRDLATLNDQDYKQDYRAIILRENSQEFLLQIIPIEADINYNYGKMWVAKKNWYPVKIEFYNEEGKLYKVLRNKKLKKINGYWRAQQIVMENHQTGSKSILYVDKIDYDQRIDDKLFQVNN
ncbi:outer membrane lipoprotein-sorting protein [Acetohalobium arabaticum]|uniref:Uncharacterized protein TP-0789 domain-containing protein n=1 Tax=Acetohalobium arabaticum (strain ATCC 49924 / DSM 5501 / Z-7288) TaxID=574087 RepID=D9QQ71_ACEAZ|nr:outer membrane lipoprotein-sorting protein [Acetohalobium arabaticum]ADL12662.1 hypothetical protein Acear_1140 [Acetohalobium arabaticum DSM 5501]